MPDQDKGKIHIMSEADKAHNAAKEAKAVKAAERERLRSDVVNQSAVALDALVKSPSVYSMGDRLIEVRESANGITVMALTKDKLSYFLRRALPTWDDEKLFNLVSKDILQHDSYPQFRRLEGTVTTPSFVRGFRFVGRSAGYDPSTGYLYHRRKELEGHRFNEGASQADACKAYLHLLDLFGDFPIPDESERANLIATMLTVVLRDALNSVVPCLAVVGNISSAGKGLVSKAISWIALGEQLASMPLPATDYEWGTRLDNLLMKGKRIALLDNIPEGKCFHHHTLESFLTSEMVTTRSGLELRNPLTFLLNGNNVSLTRDMTERVIWCKMWSADPSRRRPKINNLALYLQENWIEYFDDLITIIFAWLNAGRPEMERETILNKYGHWERTIGGIRDLCGVADFLATQVQKTDEADYEKHEVTRFIDTVVERFPHALDTGVAMMTIAELMVPGGEWHGLLSGVSGSNPINVARSLGIHLKGRYERPFGDWKMTRKCDADANLLVIGRL
jgi:hypothetical protein